MDQMLPFLLITIQSLTSHLRTLHTPLVQQPFQTVLDRNTLGSLGCLIAFKYPLLQSFQSWGLPVPAGMLQTWLGPQYARCRLCRGHSEWGKMLY